MQLDFLKGSKVQTAAGVSGTVEDVDEKGHIIVRTDAGEKKVFNFVFKDKYVTDFLTFEEEDVRKQLAAVIEEHKEKAAAKEQDSEVSPVCAEGEAIRFGRKSDVFPCFSNFHTCKVAYDGITYKNSEAAWQAQKTLDVSDRARFAGYSGSGAKSQGRRVHLRPDWEAVKDHLMEEICYAKFTQNPELKETLLSTGDKTLIENTTGWHDNYWGSCSCPKCINKPGLNHLGMALMKVRARIRREESQS